VIGIVYATGVVVAADTREIHPGGGPPRDGVGKVMQAPWGVVSGGGREDMLTRVKKSLEHRPNPSLGELHALVALVLGEGTGVLPPTELLFSYEPRGPVAPPGPAGSSIAKSRPISERSVCRLRAVTLYRDDGAAGQPAPIRAAVLPPRDIDRQAVVRWIPHIGHDAHGAPVLRSREAAVALIREGFVIFGAQSREVSPDLDLGIHEEGRRFFLTRLWW